MAVLPISVNNTALPVQPSAVRDYLLRNDSEKEALDQTLQRNTIVSPNNPTGRKYMTELTFNQLTIPQFQATNNLFTTGSGVLFNNPNSKFGNITYSGLPYVDEANDYVPGDSFLTDYKVKIRQI